MANYDLEAILQRFPALAKAALLTVMDDTNRPQTCDAVHYWPYQQEGLPYWWHRIESLQIASDVAGDMDLHVYTISAALVIAHVGADGLKGYTSDRAARWIGAYLNYMRGEGPRHLIDVSTYTTAPDWLWIEDGGVRVTGVPNGTNTLTNSGVGSQQVAVVFSLELPLLFEMY